MLTSCNVSLTSLSWLQVTLTARLSCTFAPQFPVSIDAVNRQMVAFSRVIRRTRIRVSVTNRLGLGLVSVVRIWIEKRLVVKFSQSARLGIGLGACGKYRKLTKTTENYRKQPKTTENLPKTTEINRNQLKISQETTLKWFAKRTFVWTVCLSCLSVLSVTLMYCDQTVGRIKMQLGMEVPR